MRKFLSILGAVLFTCCYLFGAGSCGGAGDGGVYGDYGGVYGEDAGGGEGGEEGAAGSDESVEIIKKPAGLLTAAAWNDNDNYEMWKALFEQGQDSTKAEGKFYNYFTMDDSTWGFTSYHRIKVSVTNDEAAVAGATVVGKDKEGNIVFEAITNANGIAYLFTDTQEGIVEVSSAEAQETVAFDIDNRELAVELSEADAKRNVIELMFVVDVTGSMGDELTYLNNEIADVVDRVALADSETQINLALLFYRDHGDREEFKYHDFVDVTNSEGLAEQQRAIAAQEATGGGDYAEAVDEALEMAVEKQWSSGTSTKLIFQILDAPPHKEAENQTTFRTAVLEAAKKGIRVCPVLCSGADLVTEYTMRQAAIYTGGTFVFITDDSGIGNAHHDPNLPNVTVEALNSLMVRLINGYHSGTFAEPIDWRQEVK